MSTRSGTPVEPVRLGACVFGAWSGGLGAVAAQCGSQPVTENSLGGDASSLAFRVNRGEIVLNDALTGTVWDVEQDKPDQDRQLGGVHVEEEERPTTRTRTRTRATPTVDRPQAKPDSYGVRAGRTTVLHPLDNDSAPEGRLLSIVDVDQPTGGSRVEISPDGQTLILQMPEDARPATFDYFIDDGRNGVSGQRRGRRRRCATRSENQPPELREGYEKPTYRVPHGGSLAVPGPRRLA